MHDVTLPPTLAQLAQQRWQQLYDTNPIETDLARLLAMSDFAFKVLQQDPTLGDWLLDELQMQSRDVPNPLPEDLSSLDEQSCFRLLRKYRQRYWLKVMWLDLVKGNDIADSIHYVSQLSEGLIDAANQWAFAQTVKQCGTPLDSKGNALPMLVLGMGKLGGGELNFSSDIDLIFCYPHNVNTQGGRKSIEAQVFYTKVAQKLIAALNQVTVDGQVFRVDMRLRPFGDSGPLVMSLSAMEDYYQDQGREWERYAMLKARLLGKANAYWPVFYQMMRPFVYRRYIDFSVIESLRKMKHMIAQEVRRKGLINNIKLGAGGIREVEFIVQALQMIRGGRDTSLQTSSLLAALSQLDALEVIPHEAVCSLRESYLYLRKIEQYLQAFDDQQTQTLPENEVCQTRLQVLMQKPDYQRCLECIQSTMTKIRDEFAQVIGDEPFEQTAFDEAFTYVWLEGDTQQLAGKLNTAQIEPWHNALQSFKEALTKRQMGARGADILDKLIPCLLYQAAEQELVAEELTSVLNIIAMIASRTAYLELLYENQGALKQLVYLCSHSLWIAEHIAKYPILLDELLDPAALYKPLPLNAYKLEIRQYFLRIEQHDLEQQMEALRQFKQAHQLRIAAADATDVLSIMKVSDHLTALAEAIIEQAVNLAWQQMIARYGQPEGCDEQTKGFAVIAYGKAGGWELGYDSDLDLVFVHNSDGDSYTQGEKCIPARQFYLKLAQRLMHLFNTRTASGILYELDTRLRPEGNSGLLAINLESFYQYQLQQAWTWEHQALVRARMVLGEQSMYERFGQIRTAILRQSRDCKELAENVVSMREKMRTHLSKDSNDAFDLKQGLGGMTDIEFLAQFLVLNFAENNALLTEHTDNVRILANAKELAILDEEEQRVLTQAYCFFREQYHKQSLNRQGKCVSWDIQLTQLSAQVAAIFKRHLGDLVK
ncbi:bifunctional [glutamate--ammonia ligase]-adenylyl-L-tyrosine phosphorylase/[glutamate--ammonia-ligase] adenylyltransferase [Pseudoalteromonas sp. MMG022]|uniref:bifunctional [glutamate--ammonia ligase]-adenylyl-L-tyrosine phosphorylase/[glutamate--ammonia-ligase] adenylyltransferase n=1 Tax=Pseudoalteromonas sp. MMG022 TaxID=2909978 RepID=UPI001F009E91|nr:bifunctional [glutamate--ammonia ligase]-adenylyl-L-tyrosine phosphorylase/[glutamate--ammonia-ligase] adenylyltransferase [Pseudoalteromonas sp. MMG022]MCF6435020.1 bifunctional [glutamate--ammonia ligase]-adenylyl-L-tyrosine phosphorylase/[glutamate--ammonia-ligase] adenylyltransferase [Pseudoalteromonas sp. MMG022]